MNKIYDEMRKAGATALVVTMSKPEVLDLYTKSHPWPFPLVSDVGCTAYKQMGLERASYLGIFLNPLTMLYYLSLMLRGWLIRMPNAGEDVLQLGGDFLIDRQRRLLAAFPTNSPAGRVSTARLLREIESVKTTH